jgi:hypothetical protein
MQGISVRNQAPEAAPWYRHRWPWLLMLGPVLVVIAGVVTGWLAWTRQDAMVVDDYYKQGKAINQDLRRDRAASLLGMGFHMRYDEEARTITGTVSRAGQGLPMQLKLHLSHATLPQKDVHLDVHPDAQGRFKVAVPMLARARWNVLVESALRDWRLAGAWHWPATDSLVLKADGAARQ